MLYVAAAAHAELLILTACPLTLFVHVQPCYSWWEVPYYWLGLKVRACMCLHQWCYEARVCIATAIYALPGPL